MPLPTKKCSFYLIGRPAKLANQRPGFLAGNSLNSCPDMDIRKKKLTLESSTMVYIHMVQNNRFLNQKNTCIVFNFHALDFPYLQDRRMIILKQ